jgi:hypothetical protein
VYGIAAAVLVIASSATSAKGQGKPTATVYPVTSTVFDTDAFGNGVVLQGDDPTAGSSVYIPGDGGVISQIDSSNADWNLDLRGSSRGFYLTLATTSGGAVPGLPAGPVFYSGRAVSRCFTPSGGTTTYSWLKVTDDPNCAMRVNFSWTGTNYTLVMSPAYQGTGLASVHCNAANGTSCVDWTVTPNANTPNAGVANLYSIAKNGSERFVAACRLTFRIRATYP